ncbi:Copper amine oxidase [Cordyceps fumosorosea ARSEF 2679]|uniref:Amine oxidase n=1 Tax=Cordyceps fumosorosea (strain ARSEF 2679) TaxID=1081104 RepID=A0A167XGY3_CORFA|nr:Copper amine oxidase [Cordyceps fumosorosea ARSEF 2679]OAA64969.1 Copper amine oxidase [Cordyceps fumosorosea ARSEF 2679]
MAATRPHPLDPLTPEEISRASVRPHFGGQELNFRFVNLLEPPKKQMVVFLDQEHQGLPITDFPTRNAHIQVVAKGSSGENQLFELIVDLDQDKVVEKQHHKGKHSYIDSAYMQAVEKACLKDENVQAEIRSLDLPPEATVVVEAWAYATDGMNDMTERLTMCWFYMRLLESPDANYYAYPLDVCAEVSETLHVTKIYRLPTTPSEKINQEKRPYDRRKIHPATASEYHPSLRPAPRTTTQPYQVVQPAGPSFRISGRLITWEGWSLRVGFNHREGLVLHDVRHADRALFHRLSLGEMFVPYGDPRAPYPRKAAFDLGNDGAGVNANDLRLGCDCLGTIAYFDAHHCEPATGEPVRLRNVVCVHEQDDGVLWKHTNFRTGRAVVARARVLVLQTIITVSNYEYVFAWHLGQDAAMAFEVRATGILSTAPTALDGTERTRYGTVVAPGVLAPYHQHLFCLRIDPAVDGHRNSLVVEESHALPLDDANPFGVGYVTRQTTVEEEGGFDLDFTKNRTFTMVNEGQVNPVTGTPVGYRLVPFYSQPLLAHASSFHARRSEFAAHAVWVTRHRDGEHFPAGRFTMQSTGGDGLATGIAARKGAAGGEGESVRDEDIVVWHAFGSTHNPRVEDWPVMPSEKMTVGLKPVNFFSGNPALDVAPARQEVNKSVLYTGEDSNEDCCLPQA